MSTESYNIKFNNTTWEIIGDEDSIICYNRTAFRSMGTSPISTYNEDVDFDGATGIFSYEDWFAFTGDSLLRTEQATKESLPIIYYATQILGYPNTEKIRDTKFVFRK